jgi:ATP-dependent Lon protease
MLSKYNIHLHVPEGGLLKMGHAGIAMLTSLVSVFTQKSEENMAMTGEITLRGKVLPVGGIKKKYWQQNVQILKSLFCVMKIKVT